MLTLVTGNPQKFKTAKARLDEFGIELMMYKMNFLEPQLESIAQITMFKVEQAYKELQKPLLISDSGWKVPALNGFPGPYMHFINEWFSTSDWLNLMQTKNDRTIILENIVVFHDGNDPKVFSTSREGKIVDSPIGEGNPVDQIVTLRDDKLTIAQCKNQGLNSYGDGDQKSPWTAFAEWYTQDGLQHLS